MFTKKDFNALKLYLRNHPTEAAEFAAMLLEIAGKSGMTDGGAAGTADEDAEWVSAKEAGQMIGKSAKFMKEHVGTIFCDCMKEDFGRRCYRFNARTVRRQYNAYVERSSSSVF